MAGQLAFSQTFGSIGGETRDSTGAVVAGAAVTAVNVGTNASRTAVTNDAGAYAFPSLPPGTYTVKVEKVGFKTVIRNQIELQVQLAARVDFELQLGQVSESIEVRADAALLVTDNATVGTVIENKRIVELPLNGRNYLQLVSLAPNVSTGFSSQGQAGARQGGIRAAQTISVAGQRTNFNHYTLDGVENTDPNFNTFVVMPSIDALQEFKVQTGVYPAEFGRQTTQINVLTKSGTNQYHGTLFEFLRNDKMDANPYSFTSIRTTKDPFKWNQYGFTLGGPVRIPKIFNGKDKLFFMGNYESYRKRGNTTGLYSLAPVAVQGGDFSAIASQNLRPQFPRPGGRRQDHHRDTVPRKRTSSKPHQPHLEKAAGVLPHADAAWRNQQLRNCAGPPAESRPVCAAHGLRGIVEIHLVRPLQLGR